MEILRVTHFEFLQLQEPVNLKVIFVEKSNKSLYLLQLYQEEVSEWDFECPKNQHSLWNCFKECCRDFFGLKIVSKNLEQLQIYKINQQYLLIYKCSFDEMTINDLLDFTEISAKNLKGVKKSPFLDILIEKRFIVDPEKSYLWILHTTSESVHQIKYNMIKDIKITWNFGANNQRTKKSFRSIERAGLIPWVNTGNGKISLFLGYKNPDGSGLTDWGGGCSKESVEECLNREFKEEFNHSLDELYVSDTLSDSVAFEIVRKGQEDKDNSGTRRSYILIFLEVPDFDELKRNFQPNSEIYGYKIVDYKKIVDNLYTGVVDGSLAFQLQEIIDKTDFPELLITSSSVNTL